MNTEEEKLILRLSLIWFKRGMFFIHFAWEKSSTRKKLNIVSNAMFVSNTAFGAVKPVEQRLPGNIQPIIRLSNQNIFFLKLLESVKPELLDQCY